ncbi:hypothetical protein EV363DRAFT_1161185 [Boletus edulis]|uniref:Uncharacterized protein n=1 Tax=Boletus edulis BED1 TaxID=1328754 RepID=A0AAD4GHZ5_BOLED|nr:hypothetical protein EV363DRAFT_1161185 [Boletus edulis]KAF8444809.1 hypothetical protein L210DRAFT_3531028 [Boletus edulis BED1]
MEHPTRTSKSIMCGLNLDPNWGEELCQAVSLLVGFYGENGSRYDQCRHRIDVSSSERWFGILLFGRNNLV